MIETELDFCFSDGNSSHISSYNVWICNIKIIYSGFLIICMCSLISDTSADQKQFEQNLITTSILDHRPALSAIVSNVHFQPSFYSPGQTTDCIQRQANTEQSPTQPSVIMVPGRPTIQFNHVKWAFTASRSQTQTKSNAAWWGQTNSSQGFSVSNIKQEPEKKKKKKHLKRWSFQSIKLFILSIIYTKLCRFAHL